ncbi:hypothetical protein GCM10009756_22720 [Pseudokineococcus marinus]
MRGGALVEPQQLVGVLAAQPPLAQQPLEALPGRLVHLHERVDVHRAPSDRGAPAARRRHATEAAAGPGARTGARRRVGPASMGA